MRKSNLKNVLFLIIGIIAGVIAAIIVGAVLPPTMEKYKMLIFFSILLGVTGVITVIGVKITGRKG